MKNAYKILVTREQLEDLDVDRRIILKWILKTGFEGMKCIHLTQDRIQCQALVKMALHF
jgi:hypothetical protein